MERQMLYANVVQALHAINAHVVLCLQRLLDIPKGDCLPTAILGQSDRGLDGVVQKLHQHRPGHDVARFRLALDSGAAHDAAECTGANMLSHACVPGGQD